MKTITGWAWEVRRVDCEDRRCLPHRDTLGGMFTGWGRRGEYALVLTETPTPPQTPDGWYAYPFHPDTFTPLPRGVVSITYGESVKVEARYSHHAFVGSRDFVQRWTEPKSVTLRHVEVVVEERKDNP